MGDFKAELLYRRSPGVGDGEILDSGRVGSLDRRMADFLRGELAYLSCITA